MAAGTAVPCHSGLLLCNGHVEAQCRSARGRTGCPPLGPSAEGCAPEFPGPNDSCVDSFSIRVRHPRANFSNSAQPREPKDERMQTASTATLALAGVLTFSVSAAAQPSAEVTPPHPRPGQLRARPHPAQLQLVQTLRLPPPAPAPKPRVRPKLPRQHPHRATHPPQLPRRRKRPLRARVSRPTPKRRSHPNQLLTCRIPARTRVLFKRKESPVPMTPSLLQPRRPWPERAPPRCLKQKSRVRPFPTPSSRKIGGLTRGRSSSFTVRCAHAPSCFTTTRLAVTICAVLPCGRNQRTRTSQPEGQRTDRNSAPAPNRTR